jgi:hypothetical protein
MGKYANNHITTAAYLTGWADPASGQLARIRVSTGAGRPPSELKKPRSVGARRRFFGPDPKVRRRAEQRFNFYEDKGIQALNRLGDSWPPRHDERIDIGCLVGVHMVRTPAFVAVTGARSRAEFERKLPSYRETMSAEQIDQLQTHFDSSTYQIDTMLDLVLKQASLLASMHWTMLEFADPLLASSDQPVSVVPLLVDGQTAPVEAAPASGFLACEEIRFPIDPWRCLLLTWIEGFDSERALHPSDGIASEINRATIAQADREWFHHPARRATVLKAGSFKDNLCGGVAHQLDPQYDTEYARTSPRRRHTNKLMEEMIDDDISNAVVWTRPVLAPGE